MCDFDPSHTHRIRCGDEVNHVTIPAICAGMGCCFDDSVGYASHIPFCFLPSIQVRTACRDMS